MRIVSYNILDGGIGRADPIGEVIAAQRADVIVLVEADDVDVVDRLVRRFKMDFVHAPGRGHGVAVLSRWTIVSSINHALVQPDAPRSLVEVTVQTPGGSELPILALHLHARATEDDETARQHEMACVLRVAHDWRTNGVPHLLVGDFNSNAPAQQIDPMRCKSSTQKAWHANGEKIPRRVIQNILDHGYIDTLRASRAHDADSMASFTTHEPGQRVDYVFAHGIDGTLIEDAWIEQDRLAQFASDHYPVGVQIILR